MLQKASPSGIMGTDMKESGNMARWMVKVKKVIYWVILILFDVLIGKIFWNDRDKYEGEWKDNKMHGQGKKIYWFSYCLMLQ